MANRSGASSHSCRRCYFEELVPQKLLRYACSPRSVAHHFLYLLWVLRRRGIFVFDELQPCGRRSEEAAGLFFLWTSQYHRGGTSLRSRTHWPPLYYSQDYCVWHRPEILGPPWVFVVAKVLQLRMPTIAVFCASKWGGRFARAENDALSWNARRNFIKLVGEKFDSSVDQIAGEFVEVRQFFKDGIRLRRCRRKLWSFEQHSFQAEKGRCHSSFLNFYVQSLFGLGWYSWGPIPVELGNLTNLVYLSLEKNKIRAVSKRRRSP